MTINITIDFFLLILLAMTLVAYLVVLARWFYYRRLAIQMELRAVVAESISEHSDHMKEKYTLTQHQKDFLNFFLDLAHDGKVVLSFLQALSQAEKIAKKGKNRHTPAISKKLEIDGNSELSADISFLMFLCIVHASTYSFFLGPRLCKRFFEFLNLSTDLQEVKKSHTHKAVISRYLNSFPFPNDFFTGTAKHA